MNENQYKPPDPVTDQERHQNPMLNRIGPPHSPLGTRDVAVLLAGAIVGGMISRGILMTKPVTLTGEAIFISLGFMPGFGCAAVIYNYLDDRGRLEKWLKGWRLMLFIILVMASGVVAAGAVSLYLSWFFFTFQVANMFAE